MQVIVVRLSPIAKNVPHRNRCGFQFNHEPMAALVTDDELKVIQNDAYLKICNFPSVAWFDALGIERTQVNEDSYKDKNGVYIALTRMPKNARIAAVISSGSKSTSEAVKAPLKSKDQEIDDTMKGTHQNNDDKPKELTASSSIDDLVKALTKKGKVEGKDFYKTSKPEALFAMLKTL